MFGLERLKWRRGAGRERIPVQMLFRTFRELLDHNNQALLTEERIDTWLAMIKPLLLVDGSVVESAAS